MREATNIVVQVIDLTGLAKEVLDYFHTNGIKAEGAKPNHKIGIVKTTKGIYALCSEGVGNNEPVTKDAPFKIDWYVDNPKTISVFPQAETGHDDDDLLGYPIAEQVKLENFIRMFGDRLEHNFSLWKNILNPIAI